jgi:hypothetical protein
MTLSSTMRWMSAGDGSVETKGGGGLTEESAASAPPVGDTASAKNKAGMGIRGM